MNNIKQISISSLFIFSSIFSPIHSFEREKLEVPLFTTKESLISTRGNAKTVITTGYGKTINEASQNAAENALKQVVGSFIDSETLIKKQKEISNGIIKLSKTINKDIQDYSQGSIQYFEILKIKENNGIVSVEARVEVLEGEFSNYIKKFAFDELNFPGEEISIMIEKNLANNNSKAKLITKKIVQPLEEGSVYSVKVGDWKIINNWQLFCRKFKNRYGQEIGNCNSFSNDDKVIVASIDISLDKKFLKNSETILENIKSKKFKVPFIETYTYNRKLYSYNKKLNNVAIGLIKSNNQESEIYLIKDVRKIINDELVKKYNSQIDFLDNDLRKSRFNNTFAIPLLMFGHSETLTDQEKVGVFEYGGPMIKFYDSNNRLILKYSCNAYECPLNDNVNFFRVSDGVIPRFSLFGCYETYGAGSSCIPTIISNSRYLLSFTFPTEVIAKIKNIKVEYQKQPGYLPKGVYPYRNLIGF